MKTRRKKSFARKLTGLIAELLVAAVLVGVILVYKNTYGKIDYAGELDADEVGAFFATTENEAGETVYLEGYTNIALFGLDNRSSGKLDSGNSDTIIIASIDNQTGDIRLVSVYRDTYLDIFDSNGNDLYRKANAAFANGGPTRAVAMLNKNLDLDITEYICVDWLAVVEAIDALGGIDLELTEKEISQINHYMGEVEKMSGFSSSAISSGDSRDGLYHLDGVKGCTFARIRKTSGDDFLRSSRQRIVLEKMLAKAKEADLATLTKLAGAIFDDISTTLTLQEMLGLAKDVGRYNIASTTGFPFELTTKYLEKTNDTVVPVGLAKNVSRLHAYLYGDEDYVPSDKVQHISDEICYYTGIADYSASIDMTVYNETVGAKGTEDAKSQNTAENTETE